MIIVIVGQIRHGDSVGKGTTSQGGCCCNTATAAATTTTYAANAKCRGGGDRPEGVGHECHLG